MKFENTPADLKKAFEALNVRHGFKPGQLVRWKEGLRSGSMRGPFIVVAVGDDDMEIWRTDLIVGYIDSDGDFMFSREDSRRLEPLPD